MILTIAMVIYNEEKHLALIERNLRLLQASASWVHVLVCDNASTDLTRSRLTELQPRIGFDLLLRNENHLGAARSEAIRKADTEWIAFVDADCILTEEWIENVRKLLAGKPTTAVFGGVWRPAGKNALIYSALFKTYLGNFGMPQLIRSGQDRLVRHVPTACAVFHRPTVIDIEGFCSQCRIVGEDLDLSYRLMSRGHRMKLLSALEFDHILPETFLGWFRKITVYGTARACMAIRHRDFLSMTYILPFLYFFFFPVCLSAGPAGRWMLAAYFASLFTASLMSTRRRTLQVAGYMWGTHVAYSCGMVWGACRYAFLSLSTRFAKNPTSEPLVHRGYTPSAVEEIV